MSEIRTNILISGESSEYRSNIEISIVTLNSALVDTHSSFRTNLDITTTLKDGSISAIKTNLELNNVALKFNLVDMTKLKQSLLYFSKFFNMYFEPEVMWDLLAQGTNEQINISHLNEALSNYVKIDTTNNILTDLERVKLNLQEHIKDNKKHFTEKEKEFLLNLMENPNSFGSGDSLFEKVSINQNNIILLAVKPLKQDGKDAGIISNTFISCRGIDSTASSGSGGITRIDLFNILSDEPISDSEFINNKFLKISPLIEDWVRHHLKEFETDPTVPDFIKKITEEQIKSWDAVASWFDISEDKSYIFTTNERGFVSHSFISCKGLDLNAASSGGSFSRSELFDILSENPQEGERINLKYLIGLEELVASFGFLKDINKNQVITALRYTPLKKDDFKDFATVSNIVKQDVDNWNFVFSLIGLSEDESYIFPKESRGFTSDSFISCKGLDISANQIGGGISEDDFSTLLFNILTGNPTEGQFINLAFLDLSSYAQKDWVNLTYATKTSLEEKANKTTTLTAGNGLTGGGTLEANRTFVLGTPSKITSTTTNAVTSESHTHEIDQASTSVVGIVKLYDALDSDSTTLALTAKQGKAIGTRLVALEDMWENRDTYLLAKNNRGIVSNSFISCRELDETVPQVGGTFDRSSLFEILSNEPQDGEFIDLRFLNLNDYVTIDYITSQGYITSNSLSGYATQQWVLNKNYASQDDIITLRTDFDNLNNLLNGNVGGVIDTWNEVVSFLDGYSQSDDLAAILSGMNTDIANRVLIEDFEKLEEAVNPLFGYFDANGNANNALKLGGHTADYFATADALNTHITAFNNYKTTTDERLGNLEALWYMDDEGNVHTTHNIVVEKGGAFGKGSGGGGDVPSGGGIDETQLWNILGQSGTQTIHSSHIPDLSGKYLPLSGGTLHKSNDNTPLVIKGTTAGAWIAYMDSDSVFLGSIGVQSDKKAYFYETSLGAVELLHSSNYSNYALPKSGGTLSGGLTISSGNLIVQSGDTVLSKVYPIADNAYTLGQNSRRWSDVKTVLINGYTPVHSGNIGDYALPINTNIQLETDYNVAGYATSVGGWPGAGAAIALGNWQGYRMYLQGRNGVLRFNTLEKGSLTGWKVVAFTDSNVASATKLQTARTIWGQRFDGSGDINGGLSIAQSSNSNYGTAITAYNSGISSGQHYGINFGYNTGSRNYGWLSFYYEDSGSVNNAVRLGVNTADVLSVTGRGNVLMGTTTDNGAKLQVDGGIYTKGMVMPNYTAIQSYLTNGTLVNLMYMSDTNLLRIGNASHKTAIMSAYVGIYTSNPAYQLDVAGTLNATTIYQNGTAIGSLAFKSSLVASDIPNLSWSKITSGKPTLLSGYGIIDFVVETISSLNNATAKAGIYRLGGTAPDNHGYGNAITLRHLSTDTYGQLYISYNMNIPKGGVYWRGAVTDSTEQSWRRILDESNYSSYALPLSGGTISSSGFAPLNIKRDSTTGAAAIAYSGQSVTYGTLGFNDVTGPKWFDMSYNEYTLIHSGNISSCNAGSANYLRKSYANENVNYAKGSGVKMIYITADGKNAPIYTSGLSVITDYGGWQMVSYATPTDSPNPYFRAMDSNGSYKVDWKQLAFLTDNVASATKLQTARTIWGQSFDGTSDVDGNIAINSDAVLERKSSAIWLNYGPANKNENLYLFGYDTQFYYGTASGYRLAMDIKPTGNILIGTTTDSGYKLDVNGCSRITEYLTFKDKSYSSTYNVNSGCGRIGSFDFPYSVTVQIGGNGTTAADKTHCFRVLNNAWSADLFHIGNSGNVGIGTETPSDKLHVVGNLLVTGGGAFGSDIRYKDIIAYQQLDLETIVKAPLFSFRWTDREDKVEHLGTSAQYWLDTQFKDAVNTANKYFFHLDYGALAVGIGISVAREVKVVKTEVELLRDEVRQLREKLNKYEQVWHN